MSYKNLNINSATTAALVGTATKARIRLREGVLQVRFTDRTSLVNLPKDEQVANLSVKGNGRRLGLRSAFGSVIEAGTKVALISAKYGWYNVVPTQDNSTIAASVTAA